MGVLHRLRRRVALWTGGEIFPGPDAIERARLGAPGRRAAIDGFSFAHSVRRVGRSRRRSAADVDALRPLARRDVGTGLHSDDRQDADRRGLSDHRHVRLFERLRRRLLLGRHPAGVVLVPAVAAGHSARRLWRDRQSRAGLVHARAALCDRRVGSGGFIFRMVRISARRRRHLRLAGARRLFLPAPSAGLRRRHESKDRPRKGAGALPQ